MIFKLLKIQYLQCPLGLVNILHLMYLIKLTLTMSVEVNTFIYMYHNL